MNSGANERRRAASSPVGPLRERVGAASLAQVIGTLGTKTWPVWRDSYDGPPERTAPHLAVDGVSAGIHGARMVRRRFKAAFACLAIIALLGNWVGPLAQARASQVVDDILGPLVICTAHGAQPLERDRDPSPPGQTQSGFHCPSCVLSKCAAVAIAIGLQTFPELSRSADLPYEAPSACRFRLNLGGIGCRAPPFPT